MPLHSNNNVFKNVKSCRKLCHKSHFIFPIQSVENSKIKHECKSSNLNNCFFGIYLEHSLEYLIILSFSEGKDSLSIPRKSSGYLNISS